MTPLDTAHATMTASPDDDAARLRYFAALADAMLFLWLEEEAQAGSVAPRVFELEDGPVVLAFDLEERLAEAAGGAVAYAELPGRVIAAQLAGQGIALGVNLGAADSAFLIPPDALEWLAQTLSHQPQTLTATPRSFHASSGLPEVLLTALERKLSRAAGLARSAWLTGVRYSDDRRGHLLAFEAAEPGAETALARAVAEALTFSGLDAGELDVVFLASGDLALARLTPTALRIDLPAPEVPEAQTPNAPGMDPSKPPILR